MARTITEIKQTITDKYIGYEEIKQAYQLEAGKTFEEQFSKVSIESILFYCVAFCAWVLETLFDTHKAECLELLDTKKPHRLKWYRNKALAFQYGKNIKLVNETDYYDNTDKTAEQIKTEQVVKYAAVVEKDGRLFIKIAGETNNKRQPLTPEQQTALTAYFSEIKDAGVKLSIINQKADAFKCEFDIYYNPMILDSEGKRLDGNGNETVQDAIKNYIENLPFNGEYSNMALIDVLQSIEGVVIAELKTSASQYGQNPFVNINAKITPDSGYLRVYNDTDLIINWIPYQTIE